MATNEKFRDAVVKHVKNYKLGDGLSEGTSHGPVQNEMQYNIVKGFFQDSIENGHCFALGEKPDDTGDSFVIKPAIIDNPPDDALVDAWIADLPDRIG